MAGTQSDHQLDMKLATYEGRSFLSAHGALLKGVLESRLGVRLITGQGTGAFQRCFQVSARPHVAALLDRHGTIVKPTLDAYSAIIAAMRTAMSGDRSFALVENAHLDETMDALVELASVPLPSGGAMCLLLEDFPAGAWATCPRQVAARLGLASLEPTNVASLRSMVEQALQISQADRKPVCMVVHASVLRTAQSLEMFPNRVSDQVEAQLQRRRRRQHPIVTQEAIGALRAARRLEVNQSGAMPSPGERVAVGFITVGPADEGLTQLVGAYSLAGRVPRVSLRVTHPIDDALIERLLDRCLQIVVLEPRPGSIEDRILRVAEAMRQRGARPATVWGRQLPDNGSGSQRSMESDSDLHPSRLRERIGPLLEPLRPGLSILSGAEQPEGPALGGRPSFAEHSVGVGAKTLNRMLQEVATWLRTQERAVDEDTTIRSVLALDGIVPDSEAERVVYAEMWDHRWFRARGTSAVAQVSGERQPTMVLIHGIPTARSEDLERLVKASIPAKDADRVQVRRLALSETVLLREALRDGAMRDDVTIVLIEESGGVSTEAPGLDRELSEIDRLGFQPRRRLSWPVEDSCSIRREALALAELPGMDPTQPWFQNDLTTSALSRSASLRPWYRIRLLHEQVQVQRVKPPVVRGEAGEATRLPLPRSLHGRQSYWRAHLAGFRSAAPGVAAWTLCEAGHTMGFAVQCIHDPTAIGPGYRAWSQVLFTNPHDEDHDQPLRGAAIPYGQADVILSVDSQELMQAVSSDGGLSVARGDRTHCIANSGGLGRKAEVFNADAIRRRSLEAVQGVTRSDTRFIEDVASACRLRFRTDRLTDMTLLGVAFQRGLLPLSLDALETALTSAERQGFGRSREAFDFGRQLGHDPASLHRGRSGEKEAPEVEARRYGLLIGRTGRRRGRRAGEEFYSLARRCLQGMPGLAETDAGRQARHDFVAALHGCVLWGGIEYAERYANLILQLYQVDRGSSGRHLTRDAILTLGEAMLIRDAMYVASTVISGSAGRRIRHTLNLKHARGDLLERRFLVRVEGAIFRRRIRANVRTSDWFVKLLAKMSVVVPKRRRGSRRARAIRQLILDYISRLIHDCESDYDHHVRVMHELYQRTERHTMRMLSLSDLRTMLGVSESSATADPETDAPDESDDSVDGSSDSL